MKQIHKNYLLFVFIISTFTSCNKLAELIPNFNVTIPIDFTLAIADNDPLSKTINTNVTFSNDSISKYKSLIKGYIIDSVTLKISEINSPTSNMFHFYTSGSSSNAIFFGNNSILVSKVGSTSFVHNSTLFLFANPNEFLPPLNTITVYDGLEVYNVMKNISRKLPLTSNQLNDIANEMLKTNNSLSLTTTVNGQKKPVSVKFTITIFAKAKLT